MREDLSRALSVVYRTAKQERRDRRKVLGFY